MGEIPSVGDNFVHANGLTLKRQESKVNSALDDHDHLPALLFGKDVRVTPFGARGGGS